MGKKILLLGATGRIGGLVLGRLVDMGADVRAFVRSPEKLPGGLPGTVEVVKGDVTDADALRAAMQGADTAIAAVNGDLLEQAKSIAAAMDGSGVSRVMWVTGMGIHHEVPGPTGKMLDALVKAQPEYVEAADLIAASGVPYTLIRAAHLTDGGNGEYFVQHEGEKLHSNAVDRVAVANFIVDMVRDEGLGVNESLGVTN